MDCSMPGSSVHGISQASLQEWIAISIPGDLPDSGIKPMSFALAGGFFTPNNQGSPALLPKPIYTTADGRWALFLNLGCNYNSPLHGVLSVSGIERYAFIVWGPYKTMKSKYCTTILSARKFGLQQAYSWAQDHISINNKWQLLLQPRSFWVQYYPFCYYW